MVRPTVSMLGTDTRRVTGPRFPDTVTNDVVVTKRFAGTGPMSAGVGTLTWATLVGIINVTGPYTARLQKISFYGDAFGSGTYGSLTVTDLTSDEASFRDFGTDGAVRPQIHLSPALMLRQNWVTNSNTNALYTVVDSNNTATAYSVYFTVELRIG